MQVALVSPVSPISSVSPAGAPKTGPEERQDSFDQIMQQSGSGQPAEDASLTQVTPGDERSTPVLPHDSEPEAPDQAQDDPLLYGEGTDALPPRSDAGCGLETILCLQALLAPLPLADAQAIPAAATGTGSLAAAEPRQALLLSSSPLQLLEPGQPQDANVPNPPGDAPPAEEAKAPTRMVASRPEHAHPGSPVSPAPLHPLGKDTPTAPLQISVPTPNNSSAATGSTVNQSEAGVVPVQKAGLHLSAPPTQPAQTQPSDSAGRVPPAFAARVLASLEDAQEPRQRHAVDPGSIAAPGASEGADAPSSIPAVSTASHPGAVAVMLSEGSVQPETTLLLPEQSSGTSTSPQASSGHSAQVRHSPVPMLPPSLGADLSAVLAQRPDGPVELTLSPEELGRLRMTLSRHGEGLQVMVQVERIDTLDLLRRHSDLLLQELRLAGFSGATFAFSDWGGRQTDAPPTQAASFAPSPPEPPAPDPQRGMGGSLDLRL